MTNNNELMKSLQENGVSIPSLSDVNNEEKGGELGLVESSGELVEEDCDRPAGESSGTLSPAEQMQQERNQIEVNANWLAGARAIGTITRAAEISETGNYTVPEVAEAVANAQKNSMNSLRNQGQNLKEYVRKMTR